MRSPFSHLDRPSPFTHLLDKAGRPLPATPVANPAADIERTVHDPSALARKIIEAGRSRRGEQGAAPPAASPAVGVGVDRDAEQFETRVADPAALARKIIEAGRKRRGEQ